MILSLKILFISVFIQLSNNEYRYTVEDYNVIKENLNTSETEVTYLNATDDINLDSYKLIVKNDEYFFINKASGLVYKNQDNTLNKMFLLHFLMNKLIIPYYSLY